MNHMKKKNEVFNLNIDYVPRPRIDRLLEQATKAQLVYVIAGAGYGKTQVVRHYIEQQPDVVVRWVQLTESDNIPSRHWENLTHMVAADNPELANKLRELGFPTTQSHFKQVAEVILEMEHRTHKTFFVLDDYHLIHSKEMLTFAERCVNLKNPEVCLIIIARIEPNINILSLLARGEASIITEKELCFTSSEVKAFFEQRTISITTQSLATLIDVTKGWALAINMFSFILQRTPAHFNHTLELMKQNIFKLLEFEAWNDLSDDVQKTMLKLSLLSNLSALPLQEITGDLQFLQQAPKLSAFIWFHSFTNDFKIHPLYLEFLQSKQHLLSEAQKQETYRLAVKWCSEKNFYMDTIYYLAKTHQYEQMLQAFLSYPFKLSCDASDYFLKILKNLDVKENLKNNPHALFLVHYFTPLLLTGVGQYEQAKEYALLVIKEWELIDNELSVVLLYTAYSNLAYIDTYLSTASHEYNGAFYLHQSVEYYRRSSITPRETTGAFINPDLRAFACTIGVGATSANFETYLEAAKEVSKLIDQTPYKIYAGYEDLVLCEYAFFKNKFHEARNHAYNAILKAREYKQHSLVILAESYLLQMAMQEGDVKLTKELLRQLTAHLDNSDFWSRQLCYDLYTSFFYVKIGMFEHVSQWLMIDEQELRSQLNNPVRELIVMVMYYVAHRKYHQALSILSASYPREKYERFLFGELRLTLLSAIARLQTHDISGAMMDFEMAYEWSFNGEFELFFIELGKELHPLVVTALKQPSCTIPTEWLKKMDRKAAIYIKKVAVIATALKIDTEHGLCVPLSDREHEVLVDLYHGLSREEIATNQHLSINTVKKILQSIYTKLNAQNSVDAIRIAIENKLLT